MNASYNNSIVHQEHATETELFLPHDLVRWMQEVTLPFWAEQGFNPKTGLFHEALSPEGAPMDHVPLRVRVQLRQIYTFSHASVMGWHRAGSDLALRAWERLVQTAYAVDGNGGFAHQLHPDGSIKDPRRDSYDHAFAILAASWLHRATGDSTVHNAISNLLAFSDQHLALESGALREGIPDQLPYRQNPQMHWFEAMLALIETGTAEGAQRRAAQHRHLFETILLDPCTTTIGEFFTANWNAAPGAAGQVIEPGHHAEWSWLLRKHETLCKLPRSQTASALLQTALRFQSPVSGLLVDEATRSGDITRGTRRSWLQTELVKAWLGEFEAGHLKAKGEALKAIAVLDGRHLRQPFAAGWIDQLDEHATPVMGAVPASILYHVFGAISEVDRLLCQPARAAADQVSHTNMIG